MSAWTCLIHTRVCGNIDVLISKGKQKKEILMFCFANLRNMLPERVSLVQLVLHDCSEPIWTGHSMNAFLDHAWLRQREPYWSRWRSTGVANKLHVVKGNRAHFVISTHISCKYKSREGARSNSKMRWVDCIHLLREALLCWVRAVDWPPQASSIGTARCRWNRLISALCFYQIFSEMRRFQAFSFYLKIE